MTTENSTYIDNTAHDAATEDNPGSNLQETAEPAEAEKSVEAAHGTGKFKSVEALMSAYLALEAEFTRRSQRLKELEENKAATAPSPACLSEEQLVSAALGKGQGRGRILKGSSGRQERSRGYGRHIVRRSGQQPQIREGSG